LYNLTDSGNLEIVELDVAEGVYLSATCNGTHGKNYLLSSESCRVSDFSLMLNKQEPKNSPRIGHINNLVK
jgi:dihydroflavonol-4-reductase